MADVVIEAAAQASFGFMGGRESLFWTSPTVGYVIFINPSLILSYRKTTDGGATWANAVPMTANMVIRYDCWADWQTAGDAGTKIHIAYTDFTDDEIRYVYLDTSGDSVAGDDLIETVQGTGTLQISVSRDDYAISITKTRGGNLAVVFKYQDNSPAWFYGFYTSPDATNWTSEASPWEATPLDWIILFPGNETDDQDLWATFWDASADEILLKTYDDSGDSWSEQSISGTMVESFSYWQMNGAVRLSDGHLIFIAWNLEDSADADLMVWDINGAGSITAKTNVLTNKAEYFLVSVLINQANNDIYVAYVGGTAIGSEVKVLYQLSRDGGGTWDGEKAMQADAEDNERWVVAGAVKAAWGGKFQPVWFNDDLDDIFCNTDNGISIASAVGIIGPFPTHFVIR